VNTSPTRRTFLSAVAATVSIVSIAPRLARAADDLHVAFVPEVATTPQSIAAKQPFIDWLEHATGRTVNLIVPTNYAATVEAVGNGSVDLAHFGGLAYLKAAERYKADALVQRSEDRAFHSLFITSSPDVKTLGDLRGKSFAFGDVLSTSGHLIPAKELVAAKIDPDADIAARFSGNHTNTAIAVNAGQVVAGALDETVYHKLVSDKTIDPQKARVFKTSEPFVDYTWATTQALDPALRAKMRDAFLGLGDQNVLALLRATKYVPSSNAEYADLRATARSLHLL
jgi:phosphonate transport system substrate-binding protein